MTIQTQLAIADAKIALQDRNAILDERARNQRVLAASPVDADPYETLDSGEGEEGEKGAEEPREELEPFRNGQEEVSQPSEGGGSSIDQVHAMLRDSAAQDKRDKKAYARKIRKREQAERQRRLDRAARWKTRERELETELAPFRVQHEAELRYDQRDENSYTSDSEDAALRDATISSNRDLEASKEEASDEEL